MLEPAKHAALAELLEGLATRLQTDRPLAVVDLETTGVNVDVDRIVEITVARFDPLTRECNSFYAVLNPGVPIPKEASDVHGFTDDAVAEKPSFANCADVVHDMLKGSDLIGYGHRRFDVRLLAAEFRRVGYSDPCEGARLIDPQVIFFQREPRTLSAALKFFTGQAHEDAHGTTGDVIATLQVLTGQLARYEDLPRTVAELDALGRDPSFIDKDGKFIWRNGQACVGFGKNLGVPLAKVDKSFLWWMLDKDFSAEAKDIARNAIKGNYPAMPMAVSA